MLIWIGSEHRNGSRIEIDWIGVEKTTFDFSREMYGAQAKNCSVPENRDASISAGKCTATQC